jgi:hypothetical protein
MRALFMATSALAACGAEGAAAESGYHWQFRPLFVLAADSGDSRLEEQRRIVAQNRAGFSERQIVIVYVVGEHVTAELGPGPGQSAAVLRKRFGAGGSGFKLVLVGKDGGAKLTSGTALPAAELFRTIDAMPMRIDEMRSR